jgi:hypothetical protein
MAVWEALDWGHAFDLRFSVTRHFCNADDLGAAALESQNRNSATRAQTTNSQEYRRVIGCRA